MHVGSSAVLEQLLEAARNEPRRLGALAAELLTVVLLERQAQVRKAVVDLGRPLENGLITASLLGIPGTPSAIADSRMAIAIRALSTACPFCPSASRNSARASSARAPVDGIC